MAWSPSKRADDLGRCLSRMRQLFWRSPELLAHRLELFAGLNTSLHTLPVLVRTIEDPVKSGGSLPTKMSIEYRSSAGEDTETTSFNVTPCTDSVLTAQTERSPPSPLLPKFRASNSAMKSETLIKAHLPQKIPSDFDDDFQILQSLAETACQQSPDAWLRRRPSATTLPTELDYALDTQNEGPGKPSSTDSIPETIDPAWISSCPLMSQSDVGKGQLGNKTSTYGLTESLGTTSPESSRAEHYHLRDLTNQGLFGTLSHLI